MQRRLQLFAALSLIVTAMMLVACNQEPTATEPASEEIEQQVETKQASVDEVLNTAQAAVGDLAAAVGTLEARIDGLQVQSDLQQLQRELNNAIEEAGDKKVAALEALSERFTDLVARVDAAAAKLPEGGPIRTELEDFSAKLKAVQADVAEAAASYEPSSTPTP